MSSVGNLKKVSVNFQAGTTPDRMDLTPDQDEFEFVFGVATEGMTPFEFELVDKNEGDVVIIRLQKTAFDKFFEHLTPQIVNLFVDREEVFLKVKIMAVVPAEQKELLKAMAEAVSHGGCDGNCGCGCGG